MLKVQSRKEAEPHQPSAMGGKRAGVVYTKVNKGEPWWTYACSEDNAVNMLLSVTTVNALTLTCGLLCCGIDAVTMAMGKAENLKLYVEFAFDTNAGLQDSLCGRVPRLSQYLGEKLGDILNYSANSFAIVDLLVAGPPCPPFSTLGAHFGIDDVRTSVFWKVLEIIAYQAKRGLRAFVIENVKGIDVKWGGATKTFLTMVLEWLAAMVPTFKVVVWRPNSEDFGMAQSRGRIFIAGAKIFNAVTGPFLKLPEDLPGVVRPMAPLKQFLKGNLPNVSVRSLPPQQLINMKAYKIALRKYIHDRKYKGQTVCIDVSRKIDGFRGGILWEVCPTFTVKNMELFVISMGEGGKMDDYTFHRFLDDDERSAIQGFPRSASESGLI